VIRRLTMALLTVASLLTMAVYVVSFAQPVYLDLSDCVGRRMYAYLVDGRATLSWSSGQDLPVLSIRPGVDADLAGATEAARDPYNLAQSTDSLCNRCASADAKPTPIASTMPLTARCSWRSQNRPGGAACSRLPSGRSRSHL